FFSSRRRHTRSKRDWSSDVCSSDLCLTAWLRPIKLIVYVRSHPAATAGLRQASCLPPFGPCRSGTVEITSCDFLSNLRYTGSKPDALPLGYAPSNSLSTFVRILPQRQDYGKRPACRRSGRAEAAR